MGIIEKLGITPAPWECGDGIYSKNPELIVIADKRSTPSGWTENIKREDLLLMGSAPEMLEALIESTIRLELINQNSEENNVSIIQKATGKSWEEIKELL